MQLRVLCYMLCIQNNITIANITFIFEQNTVIINKTNDNHKSAWILVFGGCNNGIIYSDSTTLLTTSIYSYGKNNYIHMVNQVCHSHF